MSRSKADTEVTNVLMLPDYRQDNPYQTLLSNAVANYNVQVTFPVGYRRGLPIYRAVQESASLPDVIHIHWIDPYIKGKNRVTKLIYAQKFLLDIKLVHRMGIKVIWTIHNQVSHDSHFPRIEMWIQRKLAAIIDGIILHNSTTADELAKVFGFDQRKAQIIPIGNYRDVYQPLVDSVIARKILNLTNMGRIYLYFGMLRPYKGVEQLIKAWNENQEWLTGNTLLVVGKAENPAYARHLEDMARASQGITVVPQFIPDNELHLYYSVADIVVLPFVKVLNSSSLILAMSYDKPVIAPRLGGIPETLGVAGDLLYEADDREGISNALKQSLRIDLDELSQRTEKACDQLDWKLIGQATAEYYRRIL